MRESSRFKASGNNGLQLKQRIRGILRPSSLFLSSCTSSTSQRLSSDMAQEPVFDPLRDHLTNQGNDFHADHPISYNHRSIPTVKVSVECGGCAATITSSAGLPATVAKKEEVVKLRERRVTETGIFYETGKREGGNCPPTSPPKSYYTKKIFVEKKKGKARKKMLTNGSSSFSSSSDLDEEETGTLFSSKSFSSDSSEFYYYRPSSNSRKKKEKKKMPPRRGGRTNYNKKKDGNQGYHPLVSSDSGKKKDKEKVLMVEEADSGIAVVQRSSDPYGDFRSSMVEMIVERKMITADDLERLLHRYLSLNSASHHPIIHEAFSDIWKALFGS